MAADQKKREDHERAQFEAHGAFWDKLGGSSQPSVRKAGLDDLLKSDLSAIPKPAFVSGPSRSTTPSITAPPTQFPKQKAMGSFWNTDVGQMTRDTFAEEDDGLLGFGSSASQPSSSRLPPVQKVKASVDLFDFDDLESAVPSLAVGGESGKGGSLGMRTPISDFDFGDQPVNDVKRGNKTYEDDETDLLGDLARPARVRSPELPKIEVRVSTLYLYI
jgi:hypothetical protein